MVGVRSAAAALAATLPALAIARARERPWALMKIRSKPEDRRAAVLLPVGHVLQPLDAAGEHGHARAPRAASPCRRSGPAPRTVSATPSSIFSTTLPTKPSQTMTSAVPLGMSTPSTLPTKRRPGDRLQPPVRLDHPRGPLLRLDAVGEQGHAGIRVAADHPRVGAAHDGEGHQVLRGGIDRGAHVEDEAEGIVLLAVVHRGREDGGQRGATHARE